MTRTLIGLDSTGAACVKITKGTYSPVTTADSLRDRFHFSSKWKDIMSTPAIELATLVGGTSLTYDFQPSGASSGSATRVRVAEGSGGSRTTWYFYRTTRFPQIRYAMPMTDFKYRNADGRFDGESQIDYRFGSDGPLGVRGGYVTFKYQERGIWCQNFDVGFSWGSPIGTVTMTYGSYKGMISADFAGGDMMVIVWNLPGNNVPLDGPTTTPSPDGKLAVQISSDQCRVAKPGFDVRTATPAQLAFDATGRPLSVVAAADIALPVGTTFYDTGVTLPENTVAEVQLYVGSSIFYPGSPRDENNFTATYWFDGTRIYFQNSTAACRARFIVFAADALGPTTGSNRVLRHFTEGGEDVVQFLRPGASIPPRFSDIIIDSRRPVIQILDDGYLSVPATDGYSQSVSFDATGFFPLVKFTTVHGAQGGTSQTWSAAVKAPIVKRLLPVIVSGQNQNAGDSAHCIYTSTTATFYTNRGKPVRRYWNSSGVMQFEYDTNPIIGIRYFVLGIPA